MLIPFLLRNPARCRRTDISLSEYILLTGAFDDNENKIRQDQATVFPAVQGRTSLALAEKLGIPAAARQLAS